jgi:hypothetical protein
MKQHPVQLIQARGPEDRFPDLPFYERAATETCASCRFLCRLRQHPTDNDGQYVCKEGPPTVTSVIDASGRVAGISQSFVPAHPQSWCMRWQPRTNG